MREADSGRRASDIIAEQYARIFADRFLGIDPEGWSKPWISSGVTPAQNISGNVYTGGNQFFLSLLSSMKGWRYPLFLTDRQCHSLGVHITRGEKAFPIVFCRIWWNDSSDARRPRLTEQDYALLPKEEQEGYVRKVTLLYWNGFNIDQTDFAQILPEKMGDIEKRYEQVAEAVKDASIPEVDKMLEEQGWVCNIIQQNGDRAFYSPTQDHIVVPMKEQFPDRSAFYGTLFHEMSHSTGTEGRLNRSMEGFFGSGSYAREELVAELSSAILCNLSGLDATIREDNLQYLRNWSDVISSDPDVLRTVLRDATMAADMISDHVKITQRPAIDLSDMAKDLKDRYEKGKEESHRHDSNRHRLKR